MAIKTVYPPSIFMLVPKSQLSRRHFDLHPIWSEHYDGDEREEIVQWGVDRRWLEAELARVDSGDDHCAYPILRPYPLPYRMRIYIKARFTTPAGSTLDGYVVNDAAYAIGLFVGEDEFFSSSHPIFKKDNVDLRDQLQQAIGRLEDPIFPLRYETDFIGHDGTLIAGLFTPSWPAADISERI
jgi:hypothetical protein